MNYKTLSYFIKIAEHGNLTDAAKDLKVSVSALSRYLSQLELSLDTPLFYRNGQKLTLTKAGEIYNQGSKKLLDIQNKTRYEIAQFTYTNISRIRIGVTPSGASLLTSFYPSLIQQFPKLQIRIKEGYAYELLEGIQNNSIDMLLGYYNPLLLSNVATATFFRNEIFLAVPAYHPVAASGSTDLSSIPSISEAQFQMLSDIPFAYMSDHTIMGTLITKALNQLHFHPLSEIRSKNFQLVQSLLKTGYYASFCYYEKEEASKDLVYFHMPTPLYMYTSAVFNVNHKIGEVEKYICTRHKEEYSHSAGYYEHYNELAKILLNE